MKITLEKGLVSYARDCALKGLWVGFRISPVPGGYQVRCQVEASPVTPLPHSDWDFIASLYQCHWYGMPDGYGRSWILSKAAEYLNNGGK